MANTKKNTRTRKVTKAGTKKLTKRTPAKGGKKLTTRAKKVTKGARKKPVAKRTTRRTVNRQTSGLAEAG